MKKIILLTNRYPFGDKETFIDPELRYAKDIAQIDIVPTNGDIKNLQLRSLPNGVRVNKLFPNNQTLVEKLWYTVIAIIQKSTWKEIICLRKKKKLSVKNLYQMLGFISRGNRIYKNLEKYYKNDLIYDKANIVFYSFWMLETAYAAAKLKEKYGVTAATRAHRVDLYEQDENVGVKMLPMRSFILEGLNNVYSISEDGKRYMAYNFGYDEKIKVSYLGTNDKGIRNIEISKGKFIIASCARIVPVKRIELLIQALEEIKDVPIRWIHFGDGPERKNIESEIKRLSNNIDAILMGDVEHDEVLNYYKNNDIHLFVNTSSSEGVPVSIMEAISFGIPVIATDVGGTNEVVKHDVNGICVSKDITPKELSKLITDFISMSNEEYMNLRKRTRSFWKERFDANANYTTFYKELLKGEKSDDKEV